mgnify:FL=1|tara:strand:+ start:2428 stop:2892 length:465 start_codon:yes stop_codon:yes gene_type:complete
MVTTTEIDTGAVEKELAKLGALYGAATVKAAVTSAELVRSTAIKSIQSATMGKEVTRHTSAGQSYSHTAAKAGGAPNSDTGALVNSIQVELKGSGLGKGVGVGTRLDYGRWLENGTKKMKARPWLNPALEANRANIKKLMGREIDKVTRKHGDL